MKFWPGASSFHLSNSSIGTVTTRMIITGIIVIGIIVVGVVSACAPAPAAEETLRQPLRWRSMHNGLTARVPISTIAIDPRDPQRILIGAYDPQGLYASRDGGARWQPVVGGVEGRPVYVLLNHPAQPGTLLAGTTNGLYIGRQAAREQEGSHQYDWTLIPEWPTARAVYTLIHTEEIGFLLGGDDPHVWQSADGDSWRALAPLPAGDAVLSVAAIPAREPGAAVLFAGTDGAGLFVSADGGVSWQLVEEIGETFVAALWLAPWDPQLILARTRRGLFRSQDGGQQWQRVADEVDERVDAIAAPPAERAIYLGLSSGEVVRSEDDGASWQPWGALSRDGMFYALAFSPEAPRTLWAGAQSGLYRSEDGGRTWRIASNHIGRYAASTLAMTPDGALYLGNEDGVYFSDDGGETWQLRSSGLPKRSVLSLAVYPPDPRIVYAGLDGRGVYRSDDGGRSWRLVGWEGTAIPGLAVDPTAPDRVYARIAFERIYSSDDGGATWTARWAGQQQTTEVTALTISPHDPTVLYAGAAVEFFRSDDRARSWQPMGVELRGQSVFAVAVDPVDPQRVYAGATKGLYRSDDGGVTWAHAGTGLEEITVTALAFHPRDENVLYAGTAYDGVYRTGDGGATWQPASREFSTASVRGLAVAPDGEWILAATDQGVWRSAAQ